MRSTLENLGEGLPGGVVMADTSKGILGMKEKEKKKKTRN